MCVRTLSERWAWFLPSGTQSYKNIWHSFKEETPSLVRTISSKRCLTTHVMTPALTVPTTQCNNSNYQPRVEVRSSWHSSPCDRPRWRRAPITQDVGLCSKDTHPTTRLKKQKRVEKGKCPYHQHVARDGVGQVRDGRVGICPAVALVRCLALGAASRFVTGRSERRQHEESVTKLLDVIRLCRAEFRKSVIWFDYFQAVLIFLS